MGFWPTRTSRKFQRQKPSMRKTPSFHPVPCTSEWGTVWLLLSSDKYWYLQITKVQSTGEGPLRHQVNTLDCTWRQMSNLCGVEHL